MLDTIIRTLLVLFSPFTMLILSTNDVRFSEGEAVLWTIIWTFAWMFYRDSLPENQIIQ